ncbi:pentatricopeptide repeat-containing protein At2g17670 [Cajanus cajan]|uniref:pentatricopeptide repeat-containing protein At2g17670 n=1 Tax=Cajanus cajan TaxID=3821 RepID=UPI00098D8F36|nr:pentatricopeptide repeat-containing protein At2g17670 [Cajanus cajan]
MKSTSGYAFSLGSGIFSWASKKQATVAQLTAEAEYVAATKATSQAIWLRRILAEMGEQQDGPTTIYYDNKSAIAMTKNPPPPPTPNPNPNPTQSLSPIHQTLNLMLSSSLAPDAATVDITVRALCSASRLDHIVQLLKEFASKHCPPDTFTINHLLKHLCKSRPLSSIYAFIDEMCYDFALKPDLVTYTILIDNVCNSKNLREATRLVVVLHREGFKPDCFLYNTIMKGYCALSRGREAIEVYNKMKEQGVEPDLVTYNTLIFALSKFERVSEAKKLLRAMAEATNARRDAYQETVRRGKVENDAIDAIRRAKAAENLYKEELELRKELEEEEKKANEELV